MFDYCYVNIWAFLDDGYVNSFEDAWYVDTSSFYTLEKERAYLNVVSVLWIRT